MNTLYNEDSGSNYSPSEQSSDEDSIENDVDETENVHDTSEEQNESLEKDYGAIEIQWTTNDFVPKIHDFDDQESGLKINSLDENSNELDYFTTIFSDDVVKAIVLETNRYAVQTEEKKWKDLTVCW